MIGSTDICHKIKGIGRVIITMMLTTAVLSLFPVTDCLAAENEGGYNMEEYKALVSELKEELKEGNLKTEEDVRNAVREAEQKYGVEISAEDEQKAVDIMDTVNDLGIEEDKLAEVVDDVYDKIADKTYETTSDAMDDIKEQVIDSAKDVVVDTVKESLADYLKAIWEEFKNFIKELISSWIH